MSCFCNLCQGPWRLWREVFYNCWRNPNKQTCYLCAAFKPLPELNDKRCLDDARLVPGSHAVETASAKLLPACQGEGRWKWVRSSFVFLGCRHAKEEFPWTFPSSESAWLPNQSWISPGFLQPLPSRSPPPQLQEGDAAITCVSP